MFSTMRLFTDKLFLKIQIKLCFVIHTTDIVQPDAVAENCYLVDSIDFYELSLGITTS